VTSRAAIVLAPTKATDPGVWSPQLRNRRDVDVYLPGTYVDGRRYPVMYVHDGQNLTDPATAFAGTWDLEKVLARLAERRVEPIVVGIHNTSARLAEYSPFPDPKLGGGEGDKYVAFITDTLKPRIDRLYRTRRGPAHTAILGSSMGGLISLYAWLRRPEIFGLAGVLSPSLWFGRTQLIAFIESAHIPPAGRLYLDVGTAEGAGTLRDVRALRSILRAAGMDRRTLIYLEDRGGRHHEAAWGRRSERAIEALFRRR
jgi:predicted alpha/beta superfamily hydrolase